MNLNKKRTWQKFNLFGEKKMASVKMKVKAALPFFPKKSRQRILEDLDEVLETGRLIFGKFTEKFEKRFAKYAGTRHAIALNSCTSALQASLQFFNVSKKEVIVPTNTFIATPNSVLFAGGKPKLADIDSKSLCLSLDEVKKNTGAKTKGVIAVHLGGLVCPEIFEIREFCEKKSLFLMEDAAHAHGASINGKKAGSLSNAGCFSFYPTKILTTGAGGIIATDNEKLGEFAGILRHHGGKSLESITHLGNDWLFTEIDAAIGLEQLKNLDGIVRHRNNIAKFYRKKLEGIDSIKPLQEFSGIKNAYYKFPAILEKNADKLKLVERLKKIYGIEVSSLYWPPCHMQPVYKKLFDFGKNSFPEAEKILSRQICLPMHSWLKKSDAGYVVESIEKELGKI